VYDGHWLRGKMNGAGKFFFGDGGFVFSSQWHDNFFLAEDGSCARTFPNGEPCCLKYRDYVRSKQWKRRWEDGVSYNSCWREEQAKPCLVAWPRKRNGEGGAAAQQSSSGQIVNLRGKLILVSEEAQVCPCRSIVSFVCDLRLIASSPAEQQRNNPS
jgi:hypothetical protein